MELKDRIKLARERAPLTQARLAEMVGVSRQAVLQWENGETQSIDGANLVRAARACDVDPLWLATGEGDLQGYEVRDEIYRVPPDLTRAWQQMDIKLREHLLAIAKALAARQNRG